MYDKSLLAKSSGASLGVVTVVGLVFLSTGTAFALPVAGIGGFTVEADRIEGNDMLLYPGVGDATEQADYPQSVIELQANRIEGMRLVKRIDLEDLTGGTVAGRARLTIESGGEVETGQLLMKSPDIDAETATFSGLEMRERAASDLTDSFQIGAPSDGVEGETVDLTGGDNPGLVMEDPRINATYLATDQITIPNMSLSVAYDDDGDGDYEFHG